MSDRTSAFSIRSFLLWLALLLVAAGLWVPIRGLDPYHPEPTAFWSKTVWPGLGLVMLAPMLVWRGMGKLLLRSIYTASLLFFCVILLWTPGSCLVRQAVWIVAHACATLAVWFGGRPMERRGFSLLPGDKR